uniref:CAB/ELIP/HLIP superfamily protein n=1 Tax=Rhodogorgon sp. TaxID=2485824 RepID=A0A3G3MHR8_9FLOR|nr:CAB/ELIP/HLIP superfamily protein [Rhodogorgon sp.]
MHNNLRNQWIWGFTYGAENWNGRLAMIAFVIVFVFELFTSYAVLSFISL